jgi:RNase H-fold protein (predicted Holliday junction resolvase)
MRLLDIPAFHTLLKSVNNPDMRFGKLMALDVGTKKVGVAICDETRHYISPVATLQRSLDKSISNVKLSAQLQRIVDQERIVALVVGLPLTADFQMTSHARHITTLMDSIELFEPVGLRPIMPIVLATEEPTIKSTLPGLGRTKPVSTLCPVQTPLTATYWNEYNSSVNARRLAKSLSSRPIVAKRHKDDFAACLILEGFLSEVLFHKGDD